MVSLWAAVEWQFGSRCHPSSRICAHSVLMQSLLYILIVLFPSAFPPVSVLCTRFHLPLASFPPPSLLSPTPCLFHAPSPSSSVFVPNSFPVYTQLSPRSISADAIDLDCWQPTHTAQSGRYRLTCRPPTIISGYRGLALVYPRQGRGM